MILRFLKNWTLPLAMMAGTLVYFFFARISFLAPVKPYVNALVAILTPALIFAQLLLTFCKVKVVAWLVIVVSICFVSCGSKYIDTLSDGRSLPGGV